MNTKAITVYKTGGPEVLTLNEVEISQLQQHEVLIKNEAVGLNFIDIYHRNGINPLLLPFIPGFEGAGVVEKIGAGVKAFQEGDRVAYCTATVGSYCKHRSLPADKLVPLPDDVSFQDAAAMLLKGLTAEYLVHRAYKVHPMEKVLLHAAAGGVGTILCQWLKKIGATVIGTVGSPEKAEFAKKHGCDHTILYQEEDVVAVVSELTDGQGVQVVYDSVGKTTFDVSLNCLGRRGYFVCFGNASGLPDPIPPMLLAQKGSLYFTRPRLVDYCAERDELLEAAETLFEFYRKGLKVEIEQKFALEDAEQAHRYLESRLTKGSSILLP